MADAPCIIGKGIQIRGNLSGSGGLVIRGHMEGQIALKGHIEVGETGTVVADIDTQRLTINGTMNGNIAASTTVSIATGAMVMGDIQAPEIEIHDGARFRGRLQMDVPLPDDL